MKFKQLINCNTVDSVIKKGKQLEISHDKIHLKSNILDSDGNPLIVNHTSLLMKYIDFLDDYIVEVEMSDAEFSKYMFQPRLLSYELYGTTELWSSILAINNITHSADFKIQKLKLFKSNIFDFINEILVLENREIKRNKTEIERGMKDYGNRSGYM